jgi:DNA topoisomerase VI subunit A
MKLLEFTYTKADGSVSERAVIELVTPTKAIEGIDVSDMPEHEFAEFTAEFNLLKQTQHEATMAVLAKYDLKHNYRKFLPERMANVSADYV